MLRWRTAVRGQKTKNVKCFCVNENAVCYVNEKTLRDLAGGQMYGYILCWCTFFRVVFLSIYCKSLYSRYFCIEMYASLQNNTFLKFLTRIFYWLFALEQRTNKKPIHDENKRTTWEWCYVIIWKNFKFSS